LPPPLHSQDSYGRPVFLVPGVGVAFDPPTATVTRLLPGGGLRARVQVSKAWLAVGDPLSSATRLLGPPTTWYNRDLNACINIFYDAAYELVGQRPHHLRT
jgi:hypothetical protein